MKYVCELCGYIYDETAGDQKRGIPAGTEFSELREAYDCPCCGSGYESFSPTEKRARPASVGWDDQSFWNNVQYFGAHGDSER